MLFTFISWIWEFCFLETKMEFPVSKLMKVNIFSSDTYTSWHPHSRTTMLSRDFKDNSLSLSLFQRFQIWAGMWLGCSRFVSIHIDIRLLWKVKRKPCTHFKNQYWIYVLYGGKVNNFVGFKNLVLIKNKDLFFQH